jgi:hypothetical protein
MQQNRIKIDYINFMGRYDLLVCDIRFNFKSPTPAQAYFGWRIFLCCARKEMDYGNDFSEKDTDRRLLDKRM